MENQGTSNSTITQQSKLETPPQAEVALKAELWSVLVAHKTHAWTSAIALFYLSGFLAPERPTYEVRDIGI